MKLSSIYTRIRRKYHSYREKHIPVFFVSDNANWSFKWVAHYITTGIHKQYKIPTQTTVSPWHLENKIIHFGDRYTYLNNFPHALYEENKIFLTWFHGHPNYDAGMRKLFEGLYGKTRCVEKIVVPCAITRDNLIGAGIPAEQIALIPIGVDLKRFRPAKERHRPEIRRRFNIPENAFCIGSFQKDGVGWEEGIEPKLIKGPDIFLEVISQLAHKNKNIYVLLTGPARGYVKQGLEKIGIPYHHAYLQNYHDIIPYYQALDLYLITSRAEGGPQGLMESWAVGVPVVSTRMGMPADWIKHGKNGMLAEIDDAQGLVENIQMLKDNHSLFEKCVKNGLQTVQGLEWDIIAQKYYQLYKPFLI